MDFNESKAQTCGRLADSLSFIASDLSDTMRADSEIEPGNKIVDIEEINELKENQGNTEVFNEEVFDEVIDSF